MKLAVKEGGTEYEVVGLTRDGRQFIKGERETVLWINGNFEQIPDSITVNGVRYVPDHAASANPRPTASES